MAPALKLLMPVDFSPESDVAHSFADQLAERAELDLTLAHVLRQPTAPVYPGTVSDYYGKFMEELNASAERRLADLAEHYTLNNVAVHTKVLPDDEASPGLVLAQYADHEEFDLVLAVSKHREGMDRFLMGSELTQLIRHSYVPTLLLTPGQDPSVRRLLYTTDFTEASVNALLQALPLAKLFNAGITVVKVNTPTEFMPDRAFRQASQELMDLLNRQDAELAQLVREVVPYNDQVVAEGIVRCAEDHHADVVVMATRGRSGLSRVLNGSVTEEVVGLIRRPLLVIRLPEED